MDSKALFKALRFACLPTLSILILLVCGFFSISKTIEFIASNSVLAIIIRVGLVIGELLLVYTMYNKYKEEHDKELARDYKNNTSQGYALKGDDYIYPYRLFNGDYRANDHKYLKKYTESDDIIILERVKKQTT